MKNLLILISTLFIFNSCITGKSTKQIAVINENVEKIAKNNFEKDYKIFYNKNYKFAAITKKLNSANEGNSFILKTMVYDIKEDKIIWGKKSLKGKLEWISKYEFQIKYISKDKKSNIVLYNVKTKQLSYEQ